MLTGAVQQAERSRAGQLRLWWALSDRPDLLSGAGAHGSQAVSAPAKISVDRGARGAVVPPCPWCDAGTDLVSVRDDVRCCSHCWAKNRTARCVACGRVRPVRGHDGEGRVVCGSCRQRDPLNHRRCARDRSMREVLAGADGRIRPDLQGFVDLLRRLDGRTVLRRVHKTPARRGAFPAPATATGPVTHESLDALAAETMAEHLRALLVAHGVLAVRDEHRARIEKWLPKVLGRLPDAGGERRIVERWARRQPLRRLYRPPAHRPTSPGQACGIGQEIRAVVRLLEWLPGQGTSLAACTQHTSTTASLLARPGVCGSGPFALDQPPPAQPSPDGTCLHRFSGR